MGMGRRRGPGLVGTMARTAVIAGTATAVSGNVSRRQHAKAQAGAQAATNQADAQQQIAEMQAQMNAMQAQQAAAAMPPVVQVAAPAPAAAGPDLMSQLQSLADLKTAGMLSDAEFEAAKAKILAG